MSRVQWSVTRVGTHSDNDPTSKRTDAVTSILHGTVDTYLHGTVQPNIDNLYGTVQTYMSGTAHEQLTLTGKSTHFDNDPTSTSRWTSSSRATDFPLTVTAAGFATRVAQPKSLRRNGRNVLHCAHTTNRPSAAATTTQNACFRARADDNAEVDRGGRAGKLEQPNA